jgi:hypothetical protein
VEQGGVVEGRVVVEEEGRVVVEEEGRVVEEGGAVEE